MNRKKFFVTIYNFVIKASLVVVLDVNILAEHHINGENTKKYHKSKWLTKFTLD